MDMQGDVHCCVAGRSSACMAGVRLTPACCSLLAALPATAACCAGCAWTRGRGGCGTSAGIATTTACPSRTRLTGGMQRLGLLFCGWIGGRGMVRLAGWWGRRAGALLLPVRPGGRRHVLWIAAGGARHWLEECTTPPQPCWMHPPRCSTDNCARTVRKEDKADRIRSAVQTGRDVLLDLRAVRVWWVAECGVETSCCVGPGKCQGGVPVSPALLKPHACRASPLLRCRRAALPVQPGIAERALGALFGRGGLHPRQLAELLYDREAPAVQVGSRCGACLMPLRCGVTRLWKHARWLCTRRLLRQ